MSDRFRRPARKPFDVNDLRSLAGESSKQDDFTCATGTFRLMERHGERESNRRCEPKQYVNHFQFSASPFLLQWPTSEIAVAETSYPCAATSTRLPMPSS